MGDFKKWGNLSNRGDDFEMGGGGGWYPFKDYEIIENFSPVDMQVKTESVEHFTNTSSCLGFTILNAHQLSIL